MGNSDQTVNNCGRGWCWADAQLDSFNIYTVKKPGLTYDLVSNGEEWVSCKDSMGTKGISDHLLEPYLIENAHRFYCYQQGNRWSWADCQDEYTNANGIKARKKGEGLFKLTVSESPANALLVDFTGYNYFYNNELLSLGDHNVLEFMVQFVN